MYFKKLLIHNPRILLFSTKGFLGSHLFKKFANVDCISINSLSELNTDILEKIDIFINCAGTSNVHRSFLLPDLDFQNNTLLVKNILNLIRLSGNKHIRFINFSSAAVYGNPLKNPINENDKLSPISPYGFHKKIAEELCKEYSILFGVKTLSMRLFSVYGPGQSKMLLWDLHQKVLNSNGTITLFGTGNESRDFIHIEDVFQQIILAIQHAEFKGEAINVANGIEVRIHKIAELFKKYHPNAFDYSFNGINRTGDPLNWCADISTMKDWGYFQSISINAGIRHYIENLL